MLASLAGKLDALCANFAAGNLPTGSQDPFALRRAGAGAVRILLDSGLPADLAAAVDRHLQALRQQFPGAGFDPAAAGAALKAFLWGRAETAFAEKGYPVDEVRAIGAGGLSNLPRALRHLEALHRVRHQPEFETLAAADKRASNILRQAGWQDGPDPEPARFTADEEKDLWNALQKVGAAVDARLARDEYEQGLMELVLLKAPLDRFFDNVMVMDKDEAVKRNRLALLAALKRLFSSVADLSKLQ
jgi:glycyl-tRNA synthetase beta chain